MIIVRRVFSKRKRSTQASDGSSEDDWISHAMNVAKLTSAAAKLIPVAGPFIEGGADVFYTALESLKQMKKNKEDFRDLTQTATTLLEILQRAISMTSQVQPSNEFTKMCSDFKNLMEQLLKDYKQFMAESQSRPIRNYLRSNQIGGMISQYQSNINALRDNLILFCTISTHLKVQLLKSRADFYGALQGERMVDDDIPEFKEFIEFKLGHIYLQEEIESNQDYHTISQFREYYASTLANGNTHRTTVRVYEGKAAKEVLKAELQFLARLRHPNIAQVMGFSKSEFLPSIIFYEDLWPVGLIEYYRMESRSWDTLEDIISMNRMVCDVREGVYHIQSKFPSMFECQTNSFGRIWIFYTEPEVRLGLYLGNNNHLKLSIIGTSHISEIEQDNISPGFRFADYPDNIMDESCLQALHTQLERRVIPINQIEIASLLRHFHSLIPVFPEVQSLDPSVGRYHLGGIYAHHQHHPRFQECNDPPVPQEMQLVAAFSLEDHDLHLLHNWEPQITNFTETWSDSVLTTLKRSDKGIRLSFSKSHLQNPERVLLTHGPAAIYDRNHIKNLLLHDSFMAELCHIKLRLDTAQFGSHCKLTKLSLGMPFITTDIFNELEF
ncbi:hypothetical protein M422DRAFT_248758 [Sphaerobolus stellatus SS14]|nr:hypothetical protein M422DRAFT_248758 [Sphaerobolus stellatus SS14]